MSKLAIIFGISGQDGAYLSNFLLKKKYKVIGVARSKKLINLKILGIKNKINIKYLNINCTSDVFLFLKKYIADEIYFFSGQSSVFNSYSKFEETFSSNVDNFVNVLEAIRILKRKTKIFYACSSEVFGYVQNKKFNENSQHNPLSAYALSKSISFDIAKSYRLMFGVNVCCGILFNHESILRNDNYVIKKISNYIKKIFHHKKKKLILGNLNISRDWGWAPEYVEIIWRILNNKKEETLKDYIIATGYTTSLRKVLELFFKKFNLNWKNFVLSDKSFVRPKDIIENKANIKFMKSNLNVYPKVRINEVVNKFINNKFF